MPRFAVVTALSLFALAAGQKPCVGAECPAENDAQGNLNLLQTGYAVKEKTVSRHAAASAMTYDSMYSVDPYYSDCAAMPATCTACMAFAYCADPTKQDDYCAKAPADCAETCMAYAHCGHAVGNTVAGVYPPAGNTVAGVYPPAGEGMPLGSGYPTGSGNAGMPLGSGYGTNSGMPPAADDAGGFSNACVEGALDSKFLDMDQCTCHHSCWQMHRQGDANMDKGTEDAAYSSCKAACDDSACARDNQPAGQGCTWCTVGEYCGSTGGNTVAGVLPNNYAGVPPGSVPTE